MLFRTINVILCFGFLNSISWFDLWLCDFNYTKMICWELVDSINNMIKLNFNYTKMNNIYIEIYYPINWTKKSRKWYHKNTLNTTIMQWDFRFKLKAYRRNNTAMKMCITGLQIFNLSNNSNCSMVLIIMSIFMQLNLIILTIIYIIVILFIEKKTT